MTSTSVLMESQAAALHRYGIEAEDRFVDVPVIERQAPVQSRLRHSSRSSSSLLVSYPSRMGTALAVSASGSSTRSMRSGIQRAISVFAGIS